jgi:hypothetical protein
MSAGARLFSISPAAGVITDLAAAVPAGKTWVLDVEIVNNNNYSVSVRFAVAAASAAPTSAEWRPTRIIGPNSSARIPRVVAEAGLFLVGRASAANVVFIGEGFSE